MKQVARTAGGELFFVSPDDSDVAGLASSVERGIRSVADNEQDQWRDMGYWLLPALPLDEARMAQVARAAGGDLFLVSPDDSDVTDLAASVERGIRSVADDEQDQWRDMGYWLLPALLLLLIPFFRPGGAVAFE
jgi:hypothetical protein